MASAKPFFPGLTTSPGTIFHRKDWLEKKQFLFAVTPDADLVDLLNSASHFLDIVRDLIYEAALEQVPLKDKQAWLVLHMRQSAKAVIDSLWTAVEEAAEREKQEGMKSARTGAATPAGRDTLVGTK